MTASTVTPGRALVLPLVLVLAAFAAAAYGPALNLSFIGDDYVFLDKTREASIAELWSPATSTDFGWYRPWSRELHFWVLQRLAGLHESAYRIAGLALWLLALTLYALLLRRLHSPRVAAVAVLGVASLALWGTPLLWISGSQDLWMLVFCLASLLVFVGRRRPWALPFFALALLSKETAAVLPAILTAYLLIVERRSAAAALRGTAAFWGVMAVWLLVHPTLHARLLGGQHTMELEHRPPLLGILARTVLSAANLDRLPRPQGFSWLDVGRVIASTLLLTLGAAWLMRRTQAHGAGEEGRTPGRLLAPFALTWVAVAWLPLFLPSIGWHAYYGCLGALGAWLLLALGLRHHRRAVVILMACLGLLRGAEALTSSWDWGNEWYQRRAGDILTGIRDDLYRRYETLPPHTRVFFGHIPNNVGLVAGQSPAVRTWYRDRTIEAGFYSSYRPRGASEPPGPDLFFRFDPSCGMVEVRAGPEDLEREQSQNPQWAWDHEVLAMLFLRSRDVARAAVEFEKLSLLSRHPEAAAYAGVCREVAGDTARADSLFAVARTRLHLSVDQMSGFAEQLRATCPGR